MKHLILILTIVSASCCSTKSENSVTTGNGSVTSTSQDSSKALPDCINKMIADFTKAEVENPPRKIYSFNYQGKTVYYVTPPCCDFYSDLYDSNCNLLGHPDGGITGKGDGKLPDFHSTKSGEKLLWEDKRGMKSKN
jgi:hypothetical protein